MANQSKFKREVGLEQKPIEEHEKEQQYDVHYLEIPKKVNEDGTTKDQTSEIGKIFASKVNNKDLKISTLDAITKSKKNPDDPNILIAEKKTYATKWGPCLIHRTYEELVPYVPKD